MNERAKASFELLLKDSGLELGDQMRVDAEQAAQEDSNLENGDESPVANAELSAKKSDEGASPLLITGIVTGGLGLAAAGVGVYFTVEWFRDFDRGEDAAAECKVNYSESCAETYANIDEKELPADTVGQVASYVASGALIATGVTLIIIDLKKRRGGKEKEVSVIPVPGGVGVSF